MEYIVLTETDFFRRINEADSLNDLCSSYRDFTDRVIQLCMGGMNLHHAVLALIHVETELQFHRKFYGVETDSVSGLYIRKALAFVRRTQRFLYPKCHHYPPRKPIRNRQALSVGRAALSN